MDQADFVHMVRMSEIASAENSSAYRRSVAAFAALGYAWVLGCLVLALGMVAWALPPLLEGRFKFGFVMVLISGLTLLWTSLQALWLRSDAPDGVEITAVEAPALFEALERIRRKIKGPHIHHVYLNDEFNACIRQQPRYGLLGGAVNHLTIGLPLLMALDRQRFLAVLGHEYGHLRGDHGRFAAWIYRTRMAWMRMHQGLGDDGNVVAAASNAFMRWYLPRFAARSFALARQDEYEADRIAGRLVGREVAAAALIEIEVRGTWMERHFWERHWSKAADHPVPVGPYRSLRKRLARMPEPAFANDALRQALKRLSNVDDTHPGLRDRLESLEAPPILPEWSGGSAMELLGDDAKRWIDHFDKQWCRDHATEWKQHHAWLAQVRERVQKLTAQQAQSNADEMVELARLSRHLDPRAPVQPLYALALQRSPGHAGALRGLVQSLPDEDRQGKLQCLEQLWDGDGDSRWWAARTALAELETSRPGMEHDAAAYKQWRKRLERAQEAEDRAWEELSGASLFARAVRHDLSPFEQTELTTQLARYRNVARAWLVRKQLREFPRRRAYLLFVEMPGLEPDEGLALCHRLENSLSMPGPMLVMDADEASSPEELKRHAAEPVFVR
ncbi:M48 family metalloprotease [Acidovorax sp. 210-6]|uniref:M48 family metallopeptidase n=1 Tax=Acidovorax sp. 210-6 TaxID=2699468 RepID=UPI0013898512|nr:M48 family metallopeptidase [Acidovorax sp. 210-6]NCU66716.1 M48 family metalloprotease [Acidovorax sp. 210-6]